MRLVLLIPILVLSACTGEPQGPVVPEGGETVEIVATVTSEIAADSINRALDPALPTVDIGMYLLDTQSARYTSRMPVDEVVRRYGLAQDIFEEVGVQLNLLWIRTVALEPEVLAIRSNVMAGEPAGDVPDLYEKSRLQQSTLSPEATSVFEAIVEPDPANDRTLYLVGMEDVLMGWYEQQEDGEWMLRYDSTNALSFPSYTLQDRTPRRLRGVITLQNIFKSQKIVAHELGHKLLNVSHEYRDISPAHEVDAEGGLMVYGEGTEIAAGYEGRFHRERLMRSPYLYTVGADGEKRYNPDYREGGHYADPIYEGLIRRD